MKGGLDGDNQEPITETPSLHSARAAHSRWIDALNVAGSIASVTGISLLALRNVPGFPALSYLLGYGFGASLFLAVATGLVMALGTGWRRASRAVHTGWHAIYWLVAIPVAASVAILMAQFVLAIIVPFVVLLTAGHYP